MHGQTQASVVLRIGSKVLRAPEEIGVPRECLGLQFVRRSAGVPGGALMEDVLGHLGASGYTAEWEFRFHLVDWLT